MVIEAWCYARPADGKSGGEAVGSRTRGKARLIKVRLTRPIRLYHLTHGKNLAAIVQGGELRCKAALDQTRAGYQDIAYPGIQGRRAKQLVSCGPGGVIHDYVPFYFCPRSPMLLAHQAHRVESNPDGQRPLVHLVTTVEAAEAAGCRWVFTDGHAAMAYTQFFDDLDRLGEIDWASVRSNSWADTDLDGDRKRRKQAEFLVHGALPWKLVEEIGVLDAAVKRRVEEILAASDHKPAVTVRKGWYY